MKGLSQRQQQVLELVAGYLREGVPPAAAQLAERLGLAGESSVTPVLQALARKGFLAILGGVRGRQRTLTLTAKAKQWLQQPGVPVLGRIPAGPLHEAVEQPDRFVEHLGDLLPYKPGDFLLEVVGDSMIGDGILSGDQVLIRPGVAVRDGEIAAVRVGPDAEVTLKRVVPDRQRNLVILRAANPAYPDRSFAADTVEIIGVMRGLVRSAPPRSDDRFPESCEGSPSERSRKRSLAKPPPKKR